MTTLFAPPELMAAWSYAIDGSDPAEPLAKGTHLRVFAGLGASFPLAPLAVFPITTHESEPSRFAFSDERGVAVDGDLSRFRGLDLTPAFATDETSRTVRAELRENNPGSLRQASLLDSRGRLVASRREPRYLFAAPTLSRFRLSGDASGVSLLTRVASIADLLNREAPPRAVELLGLPVTGAHPWYLGVHDRNAALHRVSDGAPLMLNPMDQPDGPFDPVSRDDEQARVEALLASGTFGGGIEALVATIVDDAGTAPWLGISKQPLGDRDQVAYVPRLAAIQMAALDPGLARFLGSATRIDDLPDLDGNQGWSALAVVGLLAIDPALQNRMPHLAAWLSAPDPDEPRLVDLLVAAIADLVSHDPRTEVDALISSSRDRGLTVRAAVAVTAPVPPWLPPVLPAPTVTDHRWQGSDGVSPSQRYRATFALAEPPLSTLVAVAADFGAGWESRHEFVDVQGAPPQRAAPRIMGHEAQPLSRIRAAMQPGGSATFQAAGLIADENLPAQAGTVRYRFRGADLFGRFGDAIETTIEPPSRPTPPPPVIRYRLDLDPRDPADLPATGGLTPGKLRLTFLVPKPTPGHEFDGIDEAALRTAIVVPGLASLAAGSLAIERAFVTIGASRHEVDVSAPGVFEAEESLPKLDPQASTDVTIKASFRDTGGNVSEESTLTVTATDRRPPLVIETGIGLLWTSAPGPSPQVQLKLTWQAAPNTRCRVYATDSQGLGLTAKDLIEPGGGIPASRGRVAEIGTNKVRGGAAIDRTRFRLLADDVDADATGHVVFETSLSRSLETVQFLRIVPLSSEGAEAPFDKCGIVPVAVPDGRRPPLPRLDVAVDAVTGEATLTVTTDGFDAVALRRDEPGLFDPGVGEAVAPSFRIRRSAGPIADPVYARQVAAGDLAAAAPAAHPPVFSASAKDTNKGRGLAPFVRYVYWAEVRLPPERRLPVGVVPLDAGVSAVDPASAVAHPRPMSLPSAAHVVMRVPAAPPPAPTAQQLTFTKTAAATGDVTLAIDGTNALQAHWLAIGPYRLAIWTQWPGAPIQPIVAAGGVPFAGTWPALDGGPISVDVVHPDAPATPASPLTVRVAFVDPSGRLGSLVAVVVN